MDVRSLENSVTNSDGVENYDFFVVDSSKLNMSLEGRCGENAITVNCIITINATI